MGGMLIFGQTGQVARELARISGRATFLGRDAADLLNPDACADAIAAAHPSTVINAAAFTAVDRAEEEETLAEVVNGAAPTAMAEACAQLDVPFVHISTDYVFDGSGSVPWPTDAVPDPIGAYGRTKRAGERGVLAAGGRGVVLRTSWVFSVHGSNFLKTMLRLGAERDRLTIVADQIGGPTPARSIAEACMSIADQLAADSSKAGLYHFSGAPDVSWAGFARAIFDEAGLTCEVEDIPTTSYPTPARRPLNSRLECSETTRVFGLQRPSWRDSVTKILKELGT